MRDESGFLCVEATSCSVMADVLSQMFKQDYEMNSRSWERDSRWERLGPTDTPDSAIQ